MTEPQRKKIKRPKTQVQEPVDINRGNAPSGGADDVLGKVLELEAQQKAKRKKTIIKVVIGIFIVGLIGVGYYYLSTGLNDKRVVELNATVAGLESTVERKNEEIEQLIKEVEDTTVKEVVPVTSLQRVEGTKVPEFVFIEGDFIAPNPLKVPNTMEDVNESYIQIGSKFRFEPSEGWRTVLRGSTLELGHPEKIWGKVKGISQRDVLGKEEYKGIIQSFFVGYPATTITYREMYMEERVIGMMGTAEVAIKTEGGETRQMVLNVGFAQRGDVGIQFMFLSEVGGVRQELIDLFLQTGAYGTGGKLKLE